MKKAGIAAVSALALSAGVLQAVAPAVAAPVEQAIQNMTLSGDAQPGGYVRADILWSLPDDAQPGDTFSVRLPDELKSVETKFPLATADGTVIAYADASDGNVVFTVADTAAGLVDRGGSAYFTLRVSEDTQPGTEVTTQYGLDTKVV